MGITMRAFKLAIISFVILFLVISGIGALLPRNVIVSRAVDINANDSLITVQVKNFKNWNNWMPLDESVTFGYNERNNTLHSGNTIISLRSNSGDSLIKTDWKTASNKMVGQFRIIKQPNDIVTIQWQMEERIGWWPWEKLSSITADKVLGGSMERSLGKLKSITEQSE
jgi:hypothetical protein